MSMKYEYEYECEYECEYEYEYFLGYLFPRYLGLLADRSRVSPVS